MRRRHFYARRVRFGHEQADAAEDATWEWYCSQYGMLMSPTRIPLETVESLLGDLISRTAPTPSLTVTFGFPGPHLTTGENYGWNPRTNTLHADAPALADELFVHGPLRLLRVAARILRPDHCYGADYHDVMFDLAGVAFNAVVAAHLRSSYDEQPVPQD